MKKQNLCQGEDDLKYWAQGKRIIGVDDAGRGPIAGNLFIGFMSFNPNSDIKNIGFNDSKQVKENIFELEAVIQGDIGYHYEQISVEEINIGESLNFLFSKKFIKGMEYYNSIPDFDNKVIFWDGNLYKELKNYPLDIICKPKYDTLSWHVAAASIIAKAAQMRAMIILDEKYPEYGFKNHNGYGTKEHFEAINKHGICPAHRKNWIDLDKIKEKYNVSK